MWGLLTPMSINRRHFLWAGVLFSMTACAQAQSWAWSGLSGPMVPLPASPAQSSLLNGLVSYWKLDETGTGTRYDAVTSSTNDLTPLFSAYRVAGKIGGASYFYAAANYRGIRHASNASLQAGTNFTLSFWILSNNSEYLSGVITKALSYFYHGNNGEWRVSLTGYDLTFQVRNAANSAWQTLTVSSALTPATWNHVLAWYSPTDAKIWLRVNNGTAVSATAADGSYVAEYKFCVGGEDDDADAFCLDNSRLDEVGYWKGRDLTAGEQDALWNGGTGVTYPFQ